MGAKETNFIPMPTNRVTQRVKLGKAYADFLTLAENPYSVTLDRVLAEDVLCL